MKPTIIYLDKSLNYQKNTGTIDIPIMTNYVETDSQVILTGIMFDKNGDTFQIVIGRDYIECPEQDLAKISLFRLIQSKSGSFVPDSKVIDDYRLSRERMIYDSIDANFGTLVREGDTIQSAKVDEITFFNNLLIKGTYLKSIVSIPGITVAQIASFLIFKFDAYQNLLGRMLTDGEL